MRPRQWARRGSLSEYRGEVRREDSHIVVRDYWDRLLGRQSPGRQLWYLHGGISLLLNALRNRYPMRRADEMC